MITSKQNERNPELVVRAFFEENNKYHPQVFLGECLHKL